MNIGFDPVQFIRVNTPSFLRFPRFLGFVKVLITSVTDLYDQTSIKYSSVIDDLVITIETDELQPYLRSIYPDVGAYKVFIKTQWDNIPQEYIQYIGEHHKIEYCKKLSEAAPTEYEFTLAERVLPYDYYVILPVAYTASLPAITAYVQRKRPAGKRFLIQFQNITS